MGSDTSLDAVTGGEIARAALRSARCSIALLRRRAVSMPTRHVGRVVTVQGVPHRVFRQTAIVEQTPASPCVLTVRFELRGLPAQRRRLRRLFERGCIVTTPFWVGSPGFATKLWLSDPVGDGFAGVYQWASAEDADRYAERLLPLLRRLSRPGTVTAERLAGTELGAYLADHGLGEPSAPAGSPAPAARAAGDGQP